MTPPLIRVLVLEDYESDFDLLAHAIRRDFPAAHLRRVDDPAALGEALLEPWDIVISDWSMPKLNALEALQMLEGLGLDVPFVIVSGTIGEETAVEAMRSGAKDYLLKGKLGRLVPVVERELVDRAERAGRRQAEEALRRSEEQFRQAQRMESIGRLAGGVAHDFNNLLSVILTYSEMGIRALSPGEPLRADLEEIKKAGHRATELTKQLLAFSRQQVLAAQVLSLNDLIANVGKMLARLIGEDIELVVSPAADLVPVLADPGQIEQVLMNLAVNARDAMPTGGKLTLETANVELAEDCVGQHFGVTPGAYAMLAVSDTGTGMDKETQARIFEPFFTTKAVGKGTGLGLATVFGIVQQSKGHIWVYSEPGRGTTFKIYLPRTDAPVTAFEPTEDELPALGGAETLLLVEDEAQIRGMVLGLLRSFGYRVLEAQDGNEALLVARKHPTAIDLLLTDVVMPNMTGDELARRLILERPALKVLCMSGYTDGAVLSHGIRDAGFAFIQKPVTPHELARKIREVLEGRKRSPPSAIG